MGFLKVKRLQCSSEKNKLGDIFLKPKQVAYLDFLYHGRDVVAVLPTGFGKSLIYQVLPFLFPVKDKSNIVIVVKPHNIFISLVVNLFLCQFL